MPGLADILRAEGETLAQAFGAALHGAPDLPPVLRDDAAWAEACGRCIESILSIVDAPGTADPAPLRNAVRALGQQWGVGLVEIQRGLMALGTAAQEVATRHAGHGTPGAWQAMHQIATAVTASVIAATEAWEAVSSAATWLTGRDAFEQAVAREIQRYERYRRPCAVILYDVDFSGVSADPTTRRQIIDAVRRLVAQVLSLSFRDTDTVARISPTGFAVLLPETPLLGAATKGERVLEHLRGAIAEVSGVATAAAVVAGGVGATDGGPLTATLLLDQAEAALRAAHAEGGDQIRVADILG